jgi:hypothetical protein
LESGRRQKGDIPQATDITNQQRRLWRDHEALLVDFLRERFGNSRLTATEWHQAIREEMTSLIEQQAR